MVSDLIIYIQSNLDSKEQLIFTSVTLIITILLYKINQKIDDKKIEGYSSLSNRTN